MAALPVSAVGVAPAASAPTLPGQYAGLATRAISFALDAVVINLAATIVGVGAALILSLVHLPETLKTLLGVLGGVAYVVWLVGYFVVFWSTTGQTPGARVMQIEVLTSAGGRLGPRRALLRCGGLLLAALPLFLGFVPVLFDDRRRAFQDQVAGTVVARASQLSLARARRREKRATYEPLR